jgi:LPXTG-site transpeptidase (sortase) family protein
MPRKKNKIVSRQTVLLFVLGISLLLLAFSYKAYNSTVLSFDSFPKKTLSKVDTSLYPISVQFLPSQYSVAVSPAQINNNRWQIAENGASFLASSAKPGEAGSIIIYAHNTKNRFGILQSVKLGDTISVVTKNGSLHSYIVREKLIVKPSETNILESKNSETLILYTCTGFADTKRLVIKAMPL